MAVFYIPLHVVLGKRMWLSIGNLVDVAYVVDTWCHAFTEMEMNRLLYITKEL